MQWTAIILAGQRPGVDPLAAHFGESYKALVRLNGEPMLAHVVRTMEICPQISRIIILAQEPEQLSRSFKSDQVEYHASGAGISASLLTLMEQGNLPLPWLVTTADHPLLDRGMVAEFLDNVAGDLAVGMVERAIMLKQFPDAQRTWLKFSDGAWSGANLFAFTGQRVGGALKLWANAEKDRKQVLRLFWHFGPWLALRAITRTIGLAKAFEIAGNRLGLDARLVPLSDPVAAIDVDKLSDHALAQQIMLQRKGL